MEQQQHLFVCILLAFCLTSSTNGGKVLVWYTEASHWINMKHVLETLVDRGHAVTVLMLFMDNKDSKFKYETFNVSFPLEEIEKFLEDYLHFSMYEMDQLSYLQIYIRHIELAKMDLYYNLKYLDGIIKSEFMMKKLKDENFDVLLADPIYPGSDLVADILGIPLVFTLRFSLVNNWERHCGQRPAPPSYVPGAMSKLTEKMDFSERVWNFGFYLLNDLMYQHFFWKDIDKYYSDVKGHPKTRAFVTHGGTNGIYEAIYHGVPMVGIPMFADQPSNIIQLKARGAALILNLNFMTTEDFRDALTIVINDKSYKENAMQLSRIHHDRPMSPRDEAIFWIEYTMRNKGAKHLRVQAHELTWFQYHSLDVLVFLLSIVLLITLLFIKACSLCFRRCCGSKRKTKRE
uniref:UDP-glucuronosyltransferase 2C1-like n=1 Tax=Cynoglossus semilaevis TaxID=244447 RepID=A0A3P8WY54_CYNSE